MAFELVFLLHSCSHFIFYTVTSIIFENNKFNHITPLLKISQYFLSYLQHDPNSPSWYTSPSMIQPHVLSNLIFNVYSPSLIPATLVYLLILKSIKLSSFGRTTPSALHILLSDLHDLLQDFSHFSPQMSAPQRAIPEHSL